jgi:hypothetical protein
VVVAAITVIHRTTGQVVPVAVTVIPRMPLITPTAAVVAVIVIMVVIAPVMLAVATAIVRHVFAVHLILS